MLSTFKFIILLELFFVCDVGVDEVSFFFYGVDQLSVPPPVAEGPLLSLLICSVTLSSASFLCTHWSVSRLSAMTHWSYVCPWHDNTFLFIIALT